MAEQLYWVRSWPVGEPGKFYWYVDTPNGKRVFRGNRDDVRVLLSREAAVRVVLQEQESDAANDIDWVTEVVPA